MLKNCWDYVNFQKKYFQVNFKKLKLWGMHVGTKSKLHHILKIDIS